MEGVSHRSKLVMGNVIIKSNINIAYVLIYFITITIIVSFSQATQLAGLFIRLSMENNILR